ncbi:MAG: T9SS type A sorting domain-containing protein [Ignavibacteria bacterium]|nr:T9SS type A sorting domain-containing protein [Ignavibacteria bacterium]
MLSDFVNTRAGFLEIVYGDMNGLTNTESTLPKTYSLSQNYPNPFNPNTNIRYDLPQDNFVTIKVYDVLGKEVLTLVNEYKQAGRYLVSFNAANFSSGIYFYTIQAGEYEYTRRMTMLK